jgi:hypothetical protein
MLNIFFNFFILSKIWIFLENEHILDLNIFEYENFTNMNNFYSEYFSNLNVLQIWTISNLDFFDFEQKEKGNKKENKEH